MEIENNKYIARSTPPSPYKICQNSYFSDRIIVVKRSKNIVIHSPPLYKNSHFNWQTFFLQNFEGIKYQKNAQKFNILAKQDSGPIVFCQIYEPLLY